jgi:4-amino-4-deoxychorismate lyase
MCLLVESIKCLDGKLCNLEFHNERMMRSMFELFGMNKPVNIEEIVSVPENATRGVFKCRVEYDTEIRKIEFAAYRPKIITSLKMVEDNTIDYRYKLVNRDCIDRLNDKKGDRDDILIIKNGFLTDTSYANVILKDRSGEWVTPSTFLLPGTRRASLLRQGKIREDQIGYPDLDKYTELKIINAMLGIEETSPIAVGNII